MEEKIKDVILVGIKSSLNDCKQLLKPKIEYYFDTHLGELSDNEQDYANLLYSLYDRINNILKFLEND